MSTLWGTTPQIFTPEILQTETSGLQCSGIMHAVSTNTPLVVRTGGLLKCSLFRRREALFQLSNPTLHSSTDPCVT